MTARGQFRSVVVVVVAIFSAPFVSSEGDAVVVNPGGTCGDGGGDRGNGICADGGCCSKFGWCGDTPAHCDGTTLPPTITSTPTMILPPETLSPATTSSPTATTSPSITGGPTTTFPTYSPTEVDWTDLTPGHTKFCGPKLVGGYEIAKMNCSPSTECGFETSETHFGHTGNDCPPGLMCFADIICTGPTYYPTSFPTYRPSTSFSPSISPTSTTSPSYVPTSTGAPTLPIENRITSRGSYCGSTYEIAIDGCAISSSCADDDDCARAGGTGESCFPNISCDYARASGGDEGGNHVTSGEEHDVARLDFEPAYPDSDGGGGMMIRRRWIAVGALVHIVSYWWQS